MWLQMPGRCGAQCIPAAELPGSPAWEPTCRPCPSTVVELNLKPWLSSGLVLAGESFSDLQQWDCLSFGEQRHGCTRRPEKAALAARGGRSAMAMPCRVPATRQQGGGHLPGRQGRCRKAARCGPAAGPRHTLTSRGWHICCGAGGGRRKGRQAGDTQPFPIQEPLLPLGLAVRGVLWGAPWASHACILTVTWHQTQCRPVMPW